MLVVAVAVVITAGMIYAVRITIVRGLLDMGMKSEGGGGCV